MHLHMGEKFPPLRPVRKCAKGWVEEKKRNGEIGKTYVLPNVFAFLPKPENAKRQKHEKAIFEVQNVACFLQFVCDLSS